MGSSPSNCRCREIHDVSNLPEEPTNTLYTPQAVCDAMHSKSIKKKNEFIKYSAIDNRSVATNIYIFVNKI